MQASKCGTDIAGGVIGPVQVFTRLEGSPWAVLGSPVEPHAPCPLIPVHCAAAMTTGSEFVRIEHAPVVRAGDVATCGHQASGRPWIRCHG